MRCIAIMPVIYMCSFFTFTIRKQKKKSHSSFSKISSDRNLRKPLRSYCQRRSD